MIHFGAFSISSIEKIEACLQDIEVPVHKQYHQHTKPTPHTAIHSTQHRQTTNHNKQSKRNQPINHKPHNTGHRPHTINQTTHKTPSTTKTQRTYQETKSRPANKHLKKAAHQAANKSATDHSSSNTDS